MRLNPGLFLPVPTGTPVFNIWRFPGGKTGVAIFKTPGDLYKNEKFSHFEHNNEGGGSTC